MKKIIIALVMFGDLLSFSPVAKADVIQPSQQELTQQLITLLTNLIAQLQQQINDILAQQAYTIPQDNIVSIPTSESELTEVPFDTPFAWYSMQVSDSIGAVIYEAKIGDILTLTFQGNTVIKTVNELTGRTNPLYYFQIAKSSDLLPSMEYYYALKLQRGNQYAVKTGTFNTLSN